MQPKPLFILILLIVFRLASAQDSAIIFSHNDYLQDQPFETAHSLGVGYVEADVFLKDDKLMVAHNANEIADKTLDNLYLSPIKSKLVSKGEMSGRQLTLMIDIKSESGTTLNAIVNHLQKYPELTTCKTLTITISGNVPDTSQWENYPAYITFDGRPNRIYSAKNLGRISFISDNFNNYSKWNGRKKITESDLKQITAVISTVHSQGKKVRFWGAPDVPGCWELLLQLGVDILGTDKIEKLNEYLKTR